MITRRLTLSLLAGAAAAPFLAPAARANAGLGEEPEPLASAVAKGDLPPMAERVPKTPRVIDLASMNRKPGAYGGTARMIIGSQKDIRFMTINGYARLIGYTQKLEFQADILERYTVEEARIYTFTLREGHRWSDGHPLTSEDFRYTWEDVILNEDLRKGGVQRELLAEGNPPRFEVVDERTVRYSWDAPNPDFLPAIAAASPVTLLLPAHYMKQFHKKYVSEDDLKAKMKAARVKKWADLHIKMSRQYRPENPDLPTLDPWRNTTALPAEQYIFDRNPYFHRVDETGRQLPYIDRFVLNISSPGIIAAKAGAGEADLQASGIDFVDYAFLKDAETRYPVKVKLWKRTLGSRVALLPNLNCSDPVWQKLLRDVRMRRALSLAINRHEINMAAFYGLGKESADTILPDSPLFKPSYSAAWSAFDPAAANRLLDELGLTERDGEGMRLLPDGRVARIVVETPGEGTLDTDVLELITDHWAKVGIPLFIKTSQREVFRNRAMGGDIIMAMWLGLDNGVPTADMNPGELAPSADSQLQWPVWGMHHLSLGQFGHAPELPEAQRLVDLLKQWKLTTTTPERAAIWQQMLAIYTDQVFSIGIVNGTLQPLLHSARMHNVPEEGLYGFEPTCYLGIYMTDTFWFGDSVS
ncbi:peptide ABC transporter substrate-binding protein [Xaviernesmea oryzae]|uniref:Peptide ABC transporter substrate-binding protein n=1 Tax=Xaviernesmea oryzae TaxID=464029 RepID=A0A1Q9B2Z0_9HYPH|nr:ABC transporter substrate-binding protein [Xaviernesmea oryzae]OLP62378.1 peptide ABC transporter substrate-binding protein [Xaviernesmea oryzae]SEL98758.1 peptide/nickel transport system substrate-binding protein [Xaviernesmea oryzae]